MVSRSGWIGLCFIDFQLERLREVQLHSKTPSHVSCHYDLRKSVLPYRSDNVMWVHSVSAPGARVPMRITKEELSTRVVVRRARRGAAPFIWEINKESMTEPVYVSPDGFGSMEDAYRAGQARLAEFVSSSRSAPAETGHYPWHSDQSGARAAYSAVFDA